MGRAWWQSTFEQGRIGSARDQGGEGGLHARFVLAVGDAEPFVGGGQYAHPGRAGGDEVVDGGGQIELSFFGLAVDREKTPLRDIELERESRMERPASH